VEGDKNLRFNKEVGGIGNLKVLLNEIGVIFYWKSKGRFIYGEGAVSDVNVLVGLMRKERSQTRKENRGMKGYML
jgi:hypothetical protein